MHGAKALACPTSRGQRMEVKKGRGSDIKWKSFDSEGNEWFSGVISLFDFKCEKASDEEIGNQLTKLLTECVRLNSDFLSKWYGFKINMFSEFPLDWGLGSSATLISCLSQWADVNPYDLSDRTFGGSGYDIACTRAESPIFYHIESAYQASIEKTQLAKGLTNNFYFVHRNKKQNSREEVARYQQLHKKVDQKLVDEISHISEELVKLKNLKDAESLICAHEKMIAEHIELPQIQDQFTDYWGCIKSLGAWGGDFILATSDRPKGEVVKYFSEKGLDTCLTWNEMMG